MKAGIPVSLAFGKIMWQSQDGRDIIVEEWAWISSACLKEKQDTRRPQDHSYFPKLQKFFYFRFLVRKSVHCPWKWRVTLYSLKKQGPFLKWTGMSWQALPETILPPVRFEFLHRFSCNQFYFWSGIFLLLNRVEKS